MAIRELAHGTQMNPEGPASGGQLAFSCKRGHFCPSCHQKRVVEFGAWLCEEVFKEVPHLHFVFSMPKILRRYFLYDRKLLSDLSRSAWETLKEFLQEAVPENNAVPGVVIAIHTFGDFLGWHPHLHVLCTDGCFYGNGMFRVSPLFDIKQMEEIFRHKVFKLLLKKEKITGELVENLARCIIRASFSQERMTYIPEESKVAYRSKDGKEEKVFDALEWLAGMCPHVPNKGQQMVRYLGFYSNRPIHL